MSYVVGGILSYSIRRGYGTRLAFLRNACLNKIGLITLISTILVLLQLFLTASGKYHMQKVLKMRLLDVQFRRFANINKNCVIFVKSFRIYLKPAISLVLA